MTQAQAKSGPLGLLPGTLRHVLCIGAHCDDIEIGCAGTLMRLQAEHPQCQFRWAVFSGDDVRERESRAALLRIHGDSRARIDVFKFKGSYLPYEGAKVKDAMEELARGPAPDLIFTHRLEDRHQDHRLLCELTWNTFRRHLILEYEIPKYEGDLGHPNVYVPMDESAVSRKVDMLLECFPSQSHRSWFSSDTFRGLMRLRGIECNAPFAEAFHARKVVL